MSSERPLVEEDTSVLAAVPDAEHGSVSIEGGFE